MTWTRYLDNFDDEYEGEGQHCGDQEQRQTSEEVREDAGTFLAS